jgi:LPS O-antigen subunit length determinant protein (WzzB/FepE family)
MIAQERRLNMEIKAVDLFHKVLTDKWVILSAAIFLALLAIFSDK